MRDKGLAAIDRYKMLQQGDRVVAALSGGADSMALLAFLWELAGPMGWKVSACHVNHGLRGDESLRDERFVREFCAKREIPLQVVRLDGEALRREKGRSLEEAAREARYQALEQAAAGGKIATGHTASDNLETILLNLARGTGLRGLCGIPPVRGRVIRPLILATRREVEEYCAAYAIPYVTDSTNLEDCYSRNRLRHQAVPALLEINPSAEEGTARMAARLRAEEELLSRLAKEGFDALEKEPNRLDRQGFLSLDPALRPRVLGIFFQRAGAGRSSRLLELAEKAAEAGTGGVEIAPGQVIAASPRWIWLREREEKAAAFRIPVSLPPPGGRCEIPTPLGTVVLESPTNPMQNSEKINNCPLKNLLDYDRIETEFAVRTRLPGDSLALPGRGVTKSLKKLGQEQRLPPRERDRLLILCDQQGIVWVEGFGPDRRTAFTSASRHPLVIYIRRETGDD